MKIHAMIFDNEHKALCGAKITIYNQQPAYAFKGKYNHISHCKKCYDRINNWNRIKPLTEAEKVRREGQF